MHQLESAAMFLALRINCKNLIPSPVPDTHKWTAIHASAERRGAKTSLELVSGWASQCYGVLARRREQCGFHWHI